MGEERGGEREEKGSEREGGCELGERRGSGQDLKFYTPPGARGRGGGGILSKERGTFIWSHKQNIKGLLQTVLMMAKWVFTASPYLSSRYTGHSHLSLLSGNTVTHQKRAFVTVSLIRRYRVTPDTIPCHSVVRRESVTLYTVSCH